MTLATRRARFADWSRQSTSLPREAWVLIAANAVAALGYGVVSPVLPAFTRTFGVSMGAVTFAIIVFSVMRLCFAPPTGLLVQRLGEQWVYLAGLLIAAVSTGASAFVGNDWQLVLFRAIGGIGSTLFFISVLGLMIRISPADARGRVAGLFASSFLIGSVADVQLRDGLGGVRTATGCGAAVRLGRIGPRAADDGFGSRRFRARQPGRGAAQWSFVGPDRPARSARRRALCLRPGDRLAAPELA